MSARWRVGLLALLPLVGCIEISPVDGTVACNPNGKACPDGYLCASDNFCRRVAGAPDLGMPDDLAQAPDDAAPGADLMPPPPDLTPACVAIQVSTLSGTGVPGLANGTGAIAQFDVPMGITADSSGTLYVTDNNNKLLRKVLSDGTTSTFSGPTGFLSAWRVANAFNTFYMVDEINDNVQLIQSTGSASLYFSWGAVIAVAVSPSNQLFITTSCGGVYRYLGTGTNPVVSYSGSAAATCAFMDGAASVAQYSNTRDIQFDSAGVLYAADTGNFRIRKVATDGSVTTLAGSTKGHTDAQGASAQFDEPSGIAIDPQSNIIYVADNTTIRAVTPSGAVTTVVGTTSGFVNGNGCVAKFGKLDDLTYFAGALYAVDVNRVRKIQLP